MSGVVLAAIWPMAAIVVIVVVGVIIALRRRSAGKSGTPGLVVGLAGFALLCLVLVVLTKRT